MKIMYYINPMLVRGDVDFYSGAVKKKLIPQAKLLQDKGHELSFMSNEFDARVIASELPTARLMPITQRKLAQVICPLRNIEPNLYGATDTTQAERYAGLVASMLEPAPDVIFVWETPGNFLQRICPGAKVIHQMPGFLSRVPFPELYNLDTFGLFNHSTISRLEAEIKRCPLDPRAERLIARIRSELLGFISSRTPFDRRALDPTGQFSRLVLLPLQITDQYAFKVDSGYESQMAFLLDVLASLPPDVGLVVTQYASSLSAEKPLNAESYAKLKSVYPNLIYESRFDLVDNISQYLVSAVDAVATASSSIGMQALLWQKPLIVIGATHLRPFATFRTVAAYGEAVSRGHDVCHDADAMLGWVLSHLQPVASLVLQNSDFLTSWLERLPSDRMNMSELPSFFDLVDDYEQVFMNESKTERASAQLRIAYVERGENKIELEFSAQLKLLKPELVSFDIFDTLLDRGVEQPTHVFKMMEANVDRLTSGRLSGFSSARQSIERSLRQHVAREGLTQEITLEQIYAELARTYDIDAATAAAIRDLELEEELRMLRRRDAGGRLFELARQAGMRVVLISDMYLPESFIRQCLNRAGYPQDVPVYLSSTIGLRKHEGDLFTHVRNQERIGYAQWFHVGDNPHGDVSTPKELGIHTFLLKSAFHCIMDNSKLGALVRQDRKTRSKAEAAIWGLIQRRFFDDPYRAFAKDTHFGGDAFNLGYVGAGALFFGFLQWVMRSAKEDGVEQLLFLSRDGKILWRMAQVLFPESEGWPAVAYALSSRRAARVASLYNIGDISQLVDSSMSTTTLANLFSKKFGVELTDADSGTLRDFSFSGPSAKVDVGDRERVRELAIALSSRILANAKLEREHLSAYYRGLGVGSRRLAVVDIGYAASMQVAIERITSAAQVGGYYYITFQSALDSTHRTGRIKGYAGDFVKPQIHHDIICRNGFLYETLFCSSDSSFICLHADGAGKVVPRFDAIEKDGERRNLVDRAHAGSMALAHDLRALYGARVADFSIDATSASRVLANFIVQPGGRDAELFEGVVFDDSFAANVNRHIVPPRSAIKKDRNCVERAVWPQGAAVFARRPDLFGSAKPAVVAKPPVVVSANPDKPVQPAKLKVRSHLASIEHRLITQMVKGRKQAKYLRDRAIFFSDSHAMAARMYWNVVGRHIGSTGP